MDLGTQKEEEEMRVQLRGNADHQNHTHVTVATGCSPRQHVDQLSLTDVQH